MAIKNKLLLLTSCFFVFSPLVVNAYGPIAHEQLSREIVRFYNLNFDKKLDQLQEDLIVAGSRMEDQHPRYLNHFYDPVYQRGLVRDAAIAPLYVLGSWLPSWLWASDAVAQNSKIYRVSAAAKGDSRSEFTWQSGISSLAKGDTKEAMMVLGHILHLLEDLAVPEHTRNDPHGVGSIYEEWVDKLLADRPDQILPKGSPVVLENLRQYFEGLATYTNNHFFSPRTIGAQSGYILPSPETFERVKEGFFALGRDHLGEYKLYFQNGMGASLLTPPRFAVRLDNIAVMQDYWSRLSSSAIQSGAGLIDLFFKEAERAKENPTPISKKTDGWLGELASITERLRRPLKQGDNATRNTDTNSYDGQPVRKKEEVEPAVSASAVVPIEKKEAVQTPKDTALPEAKTSIEEHRLDKPDIVPETAPLASAVPAAILQQTPPPIFVAVGGSLPATPEPIDETSVPVADPAPIDPPPITISRFEAELSTSSIKFSWEASIQNATSTLRDITSSTVELYEGNGDRFEAALGLNGEVRIYELEVEDGHSRALATTSLAMPAPILPGVHDLSRSEDPLRYVLSFSAKLVGASLDTQHRLEMEFLPENLPLSGAANYVSGYVASGESTSISIDNVLDGSYHWQVRVAGQSGEVTEWQEGKGEVLFSPPDRIINGSFAKNEISNGFCGTGPTEATASLVPEVDIEVTAVDFWASCGSGSCNLPNVFRIWGADGRTVLGESDGSKTKFGTLQNFRQAFKDPYPTLHAGRTYKVGPYSYNGRCLIDPYNSPANTYVLRGRPGVLEISP